jgi:hypothetical protein
MLSTRPIALRAKIVCSLIVLFCIASTCNGYRAQNNLKNVNTHSRFQQFKLHSSLSSVSPTEVKKDILGGTVLITGLKNNNEDNFLLDLINSQRKDKAEGQLWGKLVLTATDETETSENLLKKRFLTRENKYSGLLDKLAIEPYVNFQDNTILKDFLTNTSANTWIAFNVAQAEVPLVTQAALDNGIKRLIVLMQIPLADQNVTSFPEFEAAEKAFANAGAAFTGIRHGDVIDGNEDNPYEIVNASTPLMCIEPIYKERKEMSVERGVLSRVVAEMLSIEDSFNQNCGLISADKFAAAYLNVLRGSGFDRQQEVKKIFQGGLAKVARMTVATYDQRKAEEEAIVTRQLRADAKDEEERQERAAKAALLPVKVEGGKGESVERSYEETGEAQGVDFDEEIPDEYDEKAAVEERTKEILQGVWREMNSRMYAKSTSKLEFFNKNVEMATKLAQDEIEAQKQTQEEIDLEKEATTRMYDKIEEIGRKQYSKLLSLERQEIQSQKAVSNTWVKYVYLLLSVTTKHCKDTGILFNNMDEYQQTLLLRSKANELRAMVNLPSYQVIYDPLDASVIVQKLASLPIDQETKDLLSQEDDEILASMSKSYGKLLLSVSALRGAKQILQVAIETLQMELPPMPPSVRELKAFESKSQQEMRKKINLDATRNRGKPASQVGAGSKVGRL